MSKKQDLLEQMRAQMAADAARKRKTRASAPFKVTRAGTLVDTRKRAPRARKPKARPAEAGAVSNTLQLVAAEAASAGAAVYMTRAGVMQALGISEQALHDNMRRGVLVPIRGTNGKRGRGGHGTSVRFVAGDVLKLKRPADALTRAQVAKRVGRSERTVERYARTGALPKHIAAIGVGLGGERAFWLPQEVDAFLSKRAERAK